MKHQYIVIPPYTMSMQQVLIEIGKLEFQYLGEIEENDACLVLADEQQMRKVLQLGGEVWQKLIR